ncbi:hypothetical protein QCA50_019300 [Cerrena zonata]|uniref:Uncharacterized protein n=1 Tax=Cerrena zonata TaxID=2478898 RepID=A0AAW0FJG5_9APHY
MITRSLHHDYIHDYMKENLPRFQQSSAEIQSQAAIDFAESCVADPKSLPFETKMKWVGGYAMQSPLVRRNVISRTQKTERWEKEIQNVPVQIIQGEVDNHSVTDKMIPIARKYFLKLELHILKGCGHAPCFERAEETNRLMLEFVQRHSDHIQD